MQRLAVVVFLLSFLASCSYANLRNKSDRNKAAETNVKLGVAYMHQGKRAIALEKLNRALSIDPNLMSAHHSIAILYQQFGKSKLAETHFKRALELEANNGALQNNFGTYLCSQKRYEEAARHFQNAVEDPAYLTPERALENAGLCLARVPEAKNAEKYLRQALKINPNLPAALFKMAELSFDHTNFFKSRAFLQRYQSVAVHTPRTLWLGIQVEKNLGDTEAVNTYSAQLISRFPDSQEADWLVSPSVKRAQDDG